MMLILCSWATIAASGGSESLSRGGESLSSSSSRGGDSELLASGSGGASESLSSSLARGTFKFKLLHSSAISELNKFHA